MSNSAIGQPDYTVPGSTWLDQGIRWLKAREHTVLAGAAVFQVAVLLTMTALRAAPLLVGDVILVRVVPVDPRDLFRGDYVILRYEFSRMPPEGIEGLPHDFDLSRPTEWQGRTVYVSLVSEPDGIHWRADRVSVHKPASGKYLRGKLVDSRNLEFGIESYYVQEGKGHEYEQAVRERRLSAEIALTSGGQAALRGLWID